jgi:hypothetical protein
MIAKFDPTAVLVQSRTVADTEGNLRLIRVLSNGEVLSEKLIQVELSRSVCLRCLSHDVSLHPVGPVTPNRRIQLVCHNCNVRYTAYPITEE